MPSPGDGSSGAYSRGRRRRNNTRLVMAGAVLGALLILVLSTALNWTDRGGPTYDPDVGGSGQHGAAPASPPVFEAQPGSCLNWTRRDAGDIRRVNCTEPHLFEVTGTADLTSAFGPGAEYPGDDQWQQLKQERCGPVSRQYLNGLDPNGKLSVGAFTPSQEQWNAGDRVLHCGVQQPSIVGELYRMTGSARESDQSDVYRAGTCLGITGTNVSDPIDCAQAHSMEMTAVVDLSERFRAGWPAEQDQDTFLSDACERLTGEYAGGRPVTEKGLVVFWDNLPRASWDAGSRKVNCKVGAQLPGGTSLAPVTGSVRGDVRIGKEPVRDTRPFRPGAPAAGTR